MISREEGLFLLEREAHMVGGMPWGVYAFNGPAIAFNHLTIVQDVVRHKVHVAAFFNWCARGDFASAMWAITISWRLPDLFQGCSSRGMVHMSMRN